MPLYTTSCTLCAARGVIFRKIDERDNLPLCDCGGALTRILEAPAVFGNVATFPAYISPKTGKAITSREDRRADLKASGCIAWEPGIAAQVEKNRQRGIKENEAKVCAGIDETVKALNMSGRLNNG